MALLVVDGVITLLYSMATILNVVIEALLLSQPVIKAESLQLQMGATDVLTPPTVQAGKELRLRLNATGEGTQEWTWQIASNAGHEAIEVIHMRGQLGFKAKDAQDVHGSLNRFDNLVSYQRCREILESPNPASKVRGRYLYQMTSDSLEHNDDGHITSLTPRERLNQASNIPTKVSRQFPKARLNAGRFTDVNLHISDGDAFMSVLSAKDRHQKVHHPLSSVGRFLHMIPPPCCGSRPFLKKRPHMSWFMKCLTASSTKTLVRRAGRVRDALQAPRECTQGSALKDQLRRVGRLELGGPGRGERTAGEALQSDAWMVLDAKAGLKDGTDGVDGGMARSDAVAEDGVRSFMVREIDIPTALHRLADIPDHVFPGVIFEPVDESAGGRIDIDGVVGGLVGKQGGRDDAIPRRHEDGRHAPGWLVKAVGGGKQDVIDCRALPIVRRVDGGGNAEAQDGPWLGGLVCGRRSMPRRFGERKDLGYSMSTLLYLPDLLSAESATY
nr:hypothetical protein CFP56_09819 [Quercus suber]